MPVCSALEERQAPSMAHEGGRLDQAWHVGVPCAVCRAIEAWSGGPARHGTRSRPKRNSDPTQRLRTSRPLYLEPATRLPQPELSVVQPSDTSGQQQILLLHSFVYASSDMGSTDLSDYVAFEEKVRRTVYLDNLSPIVTESVLRNGLNQFGTVKSCQFIQNYTESKNIPLCALVEMGNVKQAKAVVVALGEFPFMMSGMPRPVRARLAEVEMFDDRPKKPGRKRYCCWLNPNGPDFEVAQKLKQLVRKHAAEASFLLKKQLQEEEKLQRHQEDSLKANYKKYELIEGIMGDGTAKRLAQQYGMKVLDQ
ncbi:hypothetical protein Ddye_023620 [Dipteronia dyeriana]|uniref:RRM domain-containing protein n=1 Tax=Dipteronia dyeriana TaxID=168575 RepID=A0AAD9TTA1_9ROSI|nr:hypothetical protein Ddye_023620 [Dipteronia dyeriana]